MRYLYILLALLLTLSCKRKDDVSQVDFLSKSDYGVYRGGDFVYQHNEEDGQICYEAVGYSYFRYQNDDQSKYIQFSGIGGISEGSHMKVNIVSKGLDLTDTDSEFAVKKIEGEKVWLWSDDMGIGVIFPKSK